MKHELSDTSPSVAARQRGAIQQLTGGERLRMACDMFETARALVQASLPPAVRSDPVEVRVQILLRFYGRDLAPEVIETVVRNIRNSRLQTSPDTRDTLI